MVLLRKKTQVVTYLTVEKAIGKADDEPLRNINAYQICMILKIEHKTETRTWVDMIKASTALKISTRMGMPMLPTVGFTTRVRMWPTPSIGITKISACGEVGQVHDQS